MAGGIYAIISSVMDMAKILTMKQQKEGAMLLKQGQIVGFPTETVYGLGVIYDQWTAFQALMQVKERPEHKPFTLMCSDLSMMERFAHFDERMKRVIQTFMPGPLTILVPYYDELPAWVTLHSPYVGLRISESAWVQDLIREVGKPLLVPSANRSGKEPLSRFQDVEKEFAKDVAALYQEDAGGLPPSTIIQMDDKNIICIRKGTIPFEKIETCWRNEK